MNETDGMAPAVASILDAARERTGSDERVAVAARSLQAAFARAEDDGRVPLIAEVKPTSPTADGERSDDPVELAEKMVAGGAAALSVLTEPEHFGGSPEILERVRSAVDVPILRKDFVLHEAQLDVVEADVVLLIVRFLDEDGTDDLADLLAAARDRSFQVLVEAHTAEEVERAVAAGAQFVGVNNRDLAKLEVDMGTFERAGAAAPGDVTLVAESGIGTPADVTHMREAGADALLVGSSIMDHGGDSDVEANTRRLVEAEASTTEPTETTETST